MKRSLVVLSLAVALAVAGCADEPDEALPPPPPTATPPPYEETAPPPTPPPLPRAHSWAAAGAFVWHETHVDPEVLARRMLGAGFGWVAVFLHDGTAEDVVEADWVARFRRASGLPVGGWGVLRGAPAAEAALASSLVERYGLDFYVADAEAEYEYTGSAGQDAARFHRSSEFTAAFRRLRPAFPAALSSFCRVDRHDLDWDAWQTAGFVFLPQAYVNDFGPEVTPEACARSAAPVFGATNVHPTIGMHPGARRELTGTRYANLLDHAGTVGFSVYLAETRMDEDEWRALGSAIGSRGIAR